MLEYRHFEPKYVKNTLYCCYSLNILINLILIPIQLLLIAMDVLFFFLFVRFLCYRWPKHWLITLDSIATQLVDWFAGCVRRAVSLVNKKIYSHRAILVIGMIALAIARFTLVALFSK